MNRKDFITDNLYKASGKLREAASDKFQFEPEPETIPLPRAEEPARQPEKTKVEPRSTPSAEPSRRKEIEAHRKHLAVELTKAMSEIELEDEILQDRLRETARYGELLAGVKASFDAFDPALPNAGEAIRELERMQLELLRGSTRFEQYCRTGQLAASTTKTPRGGRDVPPLMEVLSLSFFQRFMLGFTFLLPLLLVILVAAILIVCGYLAALS